MNGHLLHLHVPHPVSSDGTYFNNPHDILRQIISSLCTLEGRPGKAIVTSCRLSSRKRVQLDSNPGSPALPYCLSRHCLEAVHRSCPCAPLKKCSLFQRNPCSLIPSLKVVSPITGIGNSKKENQKKQKPAFLHFFIGSSVKTCWRCHCSRFNGGHRRNTETGTYLCPRLLL